MEPQAQTAQRVTLAEYARRIGVNRSTVTRQVQSGLIPAHDGLIDPVEADAVRQANLDQAKRRITPVPAPMLPAAAPVLSARTIEAPRDLLSGVPAADLEALASEGKAHAQEGTLKAAQIQERQAKAELAELELARQRGELVPLRQVEAAYGELVLTARNRLLLMLDEVDDPTMRAKMMRKLESILQDLSRGGAATEQAAA